MGIFEASSLIVDYVICYDLCCVQDYNGTLKNIYFRFSYHVNHISIGCCFWELLLFNLISKQSTIKASAGRLEMKIVKSQSQELEMGLTICLH